MPIHPTKRRLRTHSAGFGAQLSKASSLSGGPTTLGAGSLSAHVFIIGLTLGCYLCLTAFRDEPVAAVILFDFMACAALALYFRTAWSSLLLLHPVILYLSGQFFSQPFLELGDGPAYVAVVDQYLDSSSLTFTGDHLVTAFDPLELVKYLSLGVAPVLAIPEYFFGSVDGQVYYLWQGAFHVLLTSFAGVLALSWKVMPKHHLVAMILFAILSPSFFDLGTTPTRHVVTFFGVFLLFLSHLALVRRFSLDRGIWFAVAILVVFISKWQLLLPYLAFASLDLFLLRGKGRPLGTIVIALSTATGAVLLGSTLLESAETYLEGTAREGGATFSHLTQTPMVGWVVKFVYALLAPFPWHQWGTFTATLYGGNLFLFVMHVLSSIIGTYLFLSIAVRWRAVAAADSDFKRRLLYPIVMSLSIIGGATGFHTYLLIYFPMLAPLLIDRRFRISILAPVILIAGIEAFVMIGS
jgi:hypothetical protein